jgi:hypothetical protein
LRDPAPVAGKRVYGNEFPERPWHNGFAPRLSFAYALNPKTVVRAGYGVFFTQAFYPGWNAGMSLDGYNLNQAFGTHLDPNTNQDDPAFYLDNGVPLPAQLPPFISGAYDNGKTPNVPAARCQSTLLLSAVEPDH